jgi:hypothetical protein
MYALSTSFNICFVSGDFSELEADVTSIRSDIVFAEGTLIKLLSFRELYFIKSLPVLPRNDAVDDGRDVGDRLELVVI